MTNAWGPKDAREKGFARVPEQAIKLSALSWTRDELALYLLHCRGYSPREGGSLYGYDGARRLLKMSVKQWRDATEALSLQNLIRVVGTRNAPVTVLAHPEAPFEAGQVIETESRRSHDGHKPEFTRDRGHVLVPWRVFDEDWDDPGVRLGYLRSAGAMRLLVTCYDLARQDGRIPSNLLWLKMEGVTGPACEELTFRGACGHFADETDLATRELLRVGLLEQRDVDKKGRGVLYLYHPPMFEAESSQATAIAV